MPAHNIGNRKYIFVYTCINYVYLTSNTIDDLVQNFQQRENDRLFEK